MRRLEAVEYRLNLQTLEIGSVKTKYMSTPEYQKAEKSDALYKILAQELKSSASIVPASNQQGKDLEAFLNSAL